MCLATKTKLEEPDNIVLVQQEIIDNSDTTNLNVSIKIEYDDDDLGSTTQIKIEPLTDFEEACEYALVEIEEEGEALTQQDDGECTTENLTIIEKACKTLPLLKEKNITPNKFNCTVELDLIQEEQLNQLLLGNSINCEVTDDFDSNDSKKPKPKVSRYRKKRRYAFGKQIAKKKNLFDCNVCHKRFATKRYLNEHLDVHASNDNEQLSIMTVPADFFEESVSSMLNESAIQQNKNKQDDATKRNLFLKSKLIGTKINHYYIELITTKFQNLTVRRKKTQQNLEMPPKLLPEAKTRRTQINSTSMPVLMPAITSLVPKAKLELLQRSVLNVKSSEYILKNQQPQSIHENFGISVKPAFSLLCNSTQHSDVSFTTPSVLKLNMRDYIVSLLRQTSSQQKSQHPSRAKRQSVNIECTFEEDTCIVDESIRDGVEDVVSFLEKSDEVIQKGKFKPGSARHRKLSSDSVGSDDDVFIKKIPQAKSRRKKTKLENANKKPTKLTKNVKTSTGQSHDHSYSLLSKKCRRHCHYCGCIFTSLYTFRLHLENYHSASRLPDLQKEKTKKRNPNISSRFHQTSVTDADTSDEDIKELLKCHELIVPLNQQKSLNDTTTLIGSDSETEAVHDMDNSSEASETGSYSYRNRNEIIERSTYPLPFKNVFTFIDTSTLNETLTKGDSNKTQNAPDISKMLLQDNTFVTDEIAPGIFHCTESSRVHPADNKIVSQANKDTIGVTLCSKSNLEGTVAILQQLFNSGASNKNIDQANSKLLSGSENSEASVKLVVPEEGVDSQAALQSQTNDPITGTVIQQLTTKDSSHKNSDLLAKHQIGEYDEHYELPVQNQGLINESGQRMVPIAVTPHPARDHITSKQENVSESIVSVVESKNQSASNQLNQMYYLQDNTLYETEEHPIYLENDEGNLTVLEQTIYSLLEKRSEEGFCTDNTTLLVQTEANCSSKLNVSNVNSGESPLFIIPASSQNVEDYLGQTTSTLLGICDEKMGCTDADESENTHLEFHIQTQRSSVPVETDSVELLKTETVMNHQYESIICSDIKAGTEAEPAVENGQDDVVTLPQKALCFAPKRLCKSITVRSPVHCSNLKININTLQSAQKSTDCQIPKTNEEKQSTFDDNPQLKYNGEKDTVLCGKRKRPETLKETISSCNTVLDNCNNDSDSAESFELNLQLSEDESECVAKKSRVEVSTLLRTTKTKKRKKKKKSFAVTRRKSVKHRKKIVPLEDRPEEEVHNDEYCMKGENCARYARLNTVHNLSRLHLSLPKINIEKGKMQCTPTKATLLYADNNHVFHKKPESESETECELCGKRFHEDYFHKMHKYLTTCSDGTCETSTKNVDVECCRCKICDTSFEAPLALKLHCLVHDYDKPSTTDSNISETIKDLQHKLDDVMERIDALKEYKCKYCDMSFVSNAQLKLHCAFKHGS